MIGIMDKMTSIMHLLKTGVLSILGGIIGSILTNLFNDRKQEKEFINRVICSQDKCLREISGYMKSIESYFKPLRNSFTGNCFLENRCKKFREEKEEFKKEYYKTSKEVRNQIESFNQTFDYVAKFNMSELKTFEIFNDEIKNNYEEMAKINKKIRIKFKMDSNL